MLDMRSDGTERSPPVGRNGNQRQTEFQHLPNDEISRRAYDKSLPRDLRKRYQKEEKCRGLRNKQRRSV